MRLYKFTSPNTAPYYTLANSITVAICNYKKNHTARAQIWRYSTSQGVIYRLCNTI